MVRPPDVVVGSDGGVVIVSIAHVVCLVSLLTDGILILIGNCTVGVVNIFSILPSSTSLLSSMVTIPVPSSSSMSLCSRCNGWTYFSLNTYVGYSFEGVSNRWNQYSSFGFGNITFGYS